MPSNCAAARVVVVPPCTSRLASSRELNEQIKEAIEALPLAPRVEGEPHWAPGGSNLI